MTDLGNKKAESGGRLPQLDALRGIAALWVVIFHWTVRYDQLYQHDQSLLFRLPDGRHGVHLFFMISGFVILMTLDKIKSIRDFIVFRFTRLYPTLWACAALTAFVVFLFGLPGREVSLVDSLMNITMIPHILGFRFIDSVYWSLEVELFFYGLMAAIVAVGARRYLIHILTALVLLNVLFLALPGTVIELPGIVKALRLFLSLRYLHLFLFGIICYELTRQPKRWHYAILPLCLFVPASDFLSWTFSVSADSELISGEDFIFVFILGFLFWLGTQREVLFLRWRIFLFLGYISYPLYLLHQNIGFVMIREAYQRGVPPAFVLFVPLIVVMTLATIVSLRIEHPANSALRAWYKKRFS